MRFLHNTIDTRTTLAYLAGQPPPSPAPRQHANRLYEGAGRPRSMTNGISAADTAWMLISTAMVLLMTPAVGFFYAGLVRSKNALNTIMMCVGSFALVGIAWVVIGYSVAFGGSNRWIGDFRYILLNGVGLEAHGTIPHLLFMAYQATFAIVTAVLIAGSIAERMRFGAYLTFIGVWSVVVYAPVAHWVWGGGWLAQLGVLDYAGGTVVHINAGVASVVAATMVGSRKDFGRQAMLPHSVTLVLLGASLLYFGWFGFNAGSALAANGAAVLAFTNTMLAPCAALACWMLLDFKRTKRVTAVGAATAIVIGLVVITPAAGFVSPISGLAMGALGIVPSYFAILWRSRTRLDDSLDVMAGHGIGGMSGALLTGIFAQATWGGTDGLLFGHARQLGLQAIGVLATAVYSGAATFVVLRVLGLVMRLRVDLRSEGVGMDITQHGEEAYANGEGAVLVLNNEVSAALSRRVRTSQAGAA